MQCKWIVI